MISKSESGKLGAIASAKQAKIRRNARVETYNILPRCCEGCSAKLAYEQRHNRFCSKSCATSHNNRKFPKRLASSSKRSLLTRHTEEGSGKRYHLLICPACNKEKTVANDTIQYCSIKCQHQHNFNVGYARWLNGNPKDNVGVRTLKRFVVKHNGYKCATCKISSWNNDILTLEMEHIDGDSRNNSVANLCLLCPNCHSQTPTYKNKNKGNGRHSRRQRYKDGKSY